MTIGRTLVLAGIGLGAIFLANQGSPREAFARMPFPEQLRLRVIEAQRLSALASQRARELTEAWTAQQEGKTNVK